MLRYFLPILLFAASVSLSNAQSAIHVAIGGNDNNSGTLEAPFASIEKAIETVQPGETIYIHGGIYYPSTRIKIPAKSTNENLRIQLWAYGDGDAIIDGSKMNPKSTNEFKQSRCMYFPYDANYWHVKGLIFQNALDNGVKLEGSYNIFENCVFRGNNDTGLQIGMFKDWSIEEYKGFPATGTPEFNPGYAYCRGNKVINCDSYNNYDKLQYGGKPDNGGDADGFACKLFPGPGTEFYGCRAWNNSDDNWDLYMVYHPVVIDHCWAWNAGLDADDNSTTGNGNGFKLGGGGSSGGAAFAQSAGAHLVRNCVSFSNSVKGFDQNNAYEGMYLFNNVAWDNDYNYRFPTKFQFGGMYIRNCIGFKPKTGNHEFLSANKEGSVVPDTEFNSWTTIDGCDPYKDGNKVGKDKIYAADHSNQFRSLSVADAKADRLPDGSLPENDFARLIEGSIFIDAGTPIENFLPARFMTEEEAAAAGIELICLYPISIGYAGKAPDMGAFEAGECSDPVLPRATLVCLTGNASQNVIKNNAIEPIIFEASDAATEIIVEGLPEGISAATEGLKITLSGTPAESGRYTVTALGGSIPVSMSGTITVEPANRVLTGDWYHIQDSFDALPEDLKGVMAVESSGSWSSVWNPSYTENGDIPSGCTQGAVNVERDGALVWKLPSLLELKANVHFTGGRTLRISWQIEGEDENEWTSTKYAKTTLNGFDLMKEAGIPATEKPVTIKFINSSSLNNGGIRIYDFYAKIYAEGTTGITSPKLDNSRISYYTTESAIVLGAENIAGARLYGADGHIVSESLRSQILPTRGYHGIGILQIILTDGNSQTAKIRL